MRKKAPVGFYLLVHCCWSVRMDFHHHRLQGLQMF